MTTESLHLAIAVARNEIRRDPAAREWLDPKIAKWEEQIAEAEEQAMRRAARRRHVLRSALVFALLTAALWLGSAL